MLPLVSVFLTVGKKMFTKELIKSRYEIPGFFIEFCYKMFFKKKD